MTPTIKPHDPALCFCGTSECSCPCAECTKRRMGELRIDRVGKLMARFEKAGISVHDLADLIWHLIEPGLDNLVAKLAREELRIALKGIHLRAEVVSATLPSQTARR